MNPTNTITIFIGRIDVWMLDILGWCFVVLADYNVRWDIVKMMLNYL